MAENRTGAVDPLAIIEEEARVVAQFFGVSKCDLAAQMLVRRVGERLAGQAVYVATSRAKKDKRDQELRRRFTGNNFAELARDSGLSERQVRNIVASPRRCTEKL